MLKREITYEDFNGEKQMDVVYFNLSKAELIELEVKYERGMASMIERIVEEKNNNELVQLFKEIILMAYGQKSEDGKSFLKNDELRGAFEQTAAYQELFLELASKDGAAVEFLQGILPKDLVSNAVQLPGINETPNQEPAPTT